MGEKSRETLKLQFDKRLRLEFHGARITSDAGLLACRELDGALGLTEAAPNYLRETRGGRNVQHELVPLLRQSVYSRLAGYEDTNDATRLARDPAMQAVVGRRALERQAASINTLSRFETEVFVNEENLRGLRQLNAEWVERATARIKHQRIILDMDSSESPVYGEQEGAAYNGRGTAEQWIKEGKYAMNWTRLSCHRFVANQVRLQLFILAYNLGNFLRRLGLPRAVKDWSLQSLQLKLVKIGGRVVRHARRIIFQLAEVAMPRDLFAAILERVSRLRFAPG